MADRPIERIAIIFAAMGVLCDMQLDNHSGVYEPGQVLSGRVVMTLEQRMLIKALALKISGYADTCWEMPRKEKKRKNKHKEDVQCDPPKVYTNREDYISTTNYFIGSEEAMAKIVEQGVYAYSFSVRLPDHCPTSFESTLGRIRYEMDVQLDYPDHKQSCYTRHIYVRQPFDLQTDGVTPQPCDMEVIENKPLLKFWRRPLELVVSIPQTGYVPGEYISVHVKLMNYNALKLTEIAYRLNLVGTYTAFFKKKAQVRVERINLVTTVHSLFGQNNIMVQHLQMLNVPDTQATTLDSTRCRCMQLAYEVEVVVNTSKKKRWLSAQLPIKIGTVSLRRSAASSEPLVSASATALACSADDLTAFKIQPAETSFTPTAPSPEPTTNQFPSMSSLGACSSSFREADFMKSTNINKSSKHSKSTEQLEFKPKYIYYDMQPRKGPSNTDNDLPN